MLHNSTCIPVCYEDYIREGISQCDNGNFSSAICKSIIIFQMVVQDVKTPLYMCRKSCKTMYIRRLSMYFFVSLYNFCNYLTYTGLEIGKIYTQ